MSTNSFSRREISEEVDWEDLANEDPEGFANRISIQDLEYYIQEANRIYYNGLEEDSQEHERAVLSDNAFDALTYYYKKRTKKKEVIIGATPIKRMRKRLPFFMPSLDKVKQGKGLSEFISAGSLVYSYKLDGVSGMILYQDSELTGAYIRGDGKIGGDVSFVLDYIQFPEVECQELAIRGEFVIKKKKWQKFKGQSTGTMRNYVSGKLNSTNADESLSEIEFIAYDIISLDGECPKPIDAFEMLKEGGFSIPPFGLLKKPLSSEIANLYISSKEYCFDTDGIILARNKRREIPDILENPKDIVAFKMNLETLTRHTKVRDVEWHITRFGKLFPVIKYEPVFIEGVRLTSASGFHARRIIQEWDLRKGSVVEVVRSGGVIPQVKKVIKKGKGQRFDPEGLREETCEDDIFPEEIKWIGPHLCLVDPDSNDEVKIKRLTHFFKHLKVKGIGEGRIRSLYSAGFDTLEKILSASQKEMMTVRGIGQKLSENFYFGIREAILGARPYRIMAAADCFPHGLGKKFLREITTSIPHFMSLDEDDLYQELIKIRGIGPKRADDFIEGMRNFSVFIDIFPEIEESSLSYFEKLQRGRNKNIQGKTFVLTNFEDNAEDNEVEDYIIDHGGFIANSVSFGVVVVVNNGFDLTTKQKEAFRLDIPVYTLEEFKEDFSIGE